MKYAIVTGSTKGIGRAIAEKLLDNNCFVFLNYAHDEDAAMSVHQKFNKTYHGRFSIIKADLSSLEGLQLLLNSVYSKTDHLDYVVLNAGVLNRSNLDAVTFDEWNSVMDTNVAIPFFLVKDVKPLMKKNGSILFVSSHVGATPHSISTVYGASKAAINYMARSLVKEFADYGVTVNAVAPGFVETDMQKDIPDFVRDNKISKTAVGRFAQPNEIADLCYHMLTNRYINGSVYCIDGGYNYK